MDPATFMEIPAHFIFMKINSNSWSDFLMFVSGMLNLLLNNSRITFNIFTGILPMNAPIFPQNLELKLKKMAEDSSNPSARNWKYFGIFIDYFDITFTQTLKQNWNRDLNYSEGILGQISHFSLFLFTWFPPMPWQLKNPTFSFSLRPMLSKHWLVSTFLIWRKERAQIFL